MTSSFAGDWLLFENRGDGEFDLRQRFASTEAASCALLLDVDNDRDDECAAGLVCVQNVGAEHGFRPAVDVCR